MHNKQANSHLPSKPYLASLVAPIRELGDGHREEILQHLLLLNEADRRLRFGTQTPDVAIHHYVDGINFNRDAVFGSFDSELRLIAMAHLAYLPKAKRKPQTAEFGVSVLPECRAHGIGTALLARAAVHARNTNIEILFIHCLANNKAMMHLAQKADMQVEYSYGDADAYLKLPPANHGTHAHEAVNEQWGDFDYALKRIFKHTNEAWQWMLGKPIKTP